MLRSDDLERVQHVFHVIVEARARHGEALVDREPLARERGSGRCIELLAIAGSLEELLQRGFALRVRRARDQVVAHRVDLDDAAGCRELAQPFVVDVAR